MWNRRVAVLAAAILLAGCAGAPKQGAQAPAGNRVVAARYVGILPCTDCRGVRADLLLYTEPGGAPAGYELLQTYLGARDGDRSLTRSGAWSSGRGVTQDPQGLVIQLDAEKTGSTRSFRQVGPRVLRALDANLADLPPHMPRSLLRVPDNLPTSAIVLTQGDAGNRVEVPVGQQVVLMLASQPGSGYRWTVAAEPSGALERAAEPVHVPDTAGTGFDVFRYNAVKSGVQGLKLEYRVPSDTATPPVQTATFQIAVP